MAENTKIEWCDASVNFWWGCTKVSQGCANCYTETSSHPFGGSGTTGKVAIENGRRAILCEMNPEYVELIESRCSTTIGLPLA